MTRKAGSAPPAPTDSAPEDHVELLLDQALAATFPASDPVALTLDRRADVVTAVMRTDVAATRA